jgi:RNA-directed DNA polymerase
MKRECHVRFCESGGVRLPSATRLVVLCRSREAADSALARMRAWIDANGLMLHPDKTHVGDVGWRVKGSSSSDTGLRQGSV